MVGHVAPEAADGAPLALLRKGDMVVIDVENRRLDHELDAAEVAARKAAWKKLTPGYTNCVFVKYIARWCHPQTTMRSPELGLGYRRLARLAAGPERVRPRIV